MINILIPYEYSTFFFLLSACNSVACGENHKQIRYLLNYPFKSRIFVVQQLIYRATKVFSFFSLVKCVIYVKLFNLTC